MSAQAVCVSLRRFIAAIGVLVFCLMAALQPRAQAAVPTPGQASPIHEQQGRTTGGTSPTGSTQQKEDIPSSEKYTPMTSDELTDQLNQTEKALKGPMLLIERKVISGSVQLDFKQRPIPFRVEFHGCEFRDEVEIRGVDFYSSVVFSETTFDKGLVLEHVHIKGDLRLEEGQVNKGGIIQLNQTVVDGDVRIKSLVVDELQAEYLTAGNLIVSLGPPHITRMDLKHLATTRLSIAADGRVVRNIDELDLDSANLRETLALQSLTLQKVSAIGLIVGKRTLFLPTTSIEKLLDLSSSNLGSFSWTFSTTTPVALPQKLKINGASFIALNLTPVSPPGRTESDSEEIRLRQGHTDYGLLFLQKAGYFEPAYAAYESSLKTQGQADAADAVYFAMRDRRRYTEWQDASTSWSKVVGGFDYVVGFGHKWLFGYGRSWTYPMVWCVIFVLIGTVIFRDSGRMQRLDEQSSHPFSPLWYSLDLFVPILSLGMATSWSPKREHGLLLFYSKFLSLIGLVFISAMVGALTGTLK